MNCRKAQRLMSEKLDGALSSLEEHLLAEHVATCDTCRKATQAFPKLENLIAERRSLPETDWKGFESQVMRRVSEESRVQRRSPMETSRFWRFARVAAAAIFLLGTAGVFLILSKRGSEPRPGDLSSPATGIADATYAGAGESVALTFEGKKLLKGYILETPPTPPEMALVIAHPLPVPRRKVTLAAASRSHTLDEKEPSAIVVVVCQ